MRSMASSGVSSSGVSSSWVAYQEATLERVLQSQQGAPLEVLLDLAQLRLRHGALAQLVHLAQDGLQGRVDLLRLDAGG